ncbi:MAG: hypothetical protein HKO66_16130 [Saprospiraceae bacterium]|nr:hypothetical protein [Bacteroidia bacterium]NNE16555.1 hypothetical protein [Saprospiraceae bacterium]NNL93772.1 hypothetical protein [Saprospiraceae bacterium]
MKKLISNFKPMRLLSFFALIATITITSCSDDENTVLLDANFDYAFHNGQTVPSAPYTGLHSGDLSANLALEELEDGGTRITVTLMNTMDGETYRIHAHDAADASTTPNGTPYSESPNVDILAQNVTGNGGTVSVSQDTDMSFDDLTSSYEGFFVVHDPLQPINTADITTYLVVGSFARMQSNTTYESSDFSYAFNTGQVASAFAYAGSHSSDLGARINVTELADNKSRITVMIDNSMEGQTYHTHAHDMADPTTTPNGTPYNESPNAMVFASPIVGNGGTAGKSFVSDMSYTEITTNYNGFFVIHDPLQGITTVDPTTYVILGVFAR